MAESGDRGTDKDLYEKQLQDLAKLTMADIKPQEARKLELNPGKVGQRELTIQVPWGVIEAKTWGNALTGKPMLAIHGWMDNCSTFDRLIPLIPQGLYVVAIDLPGHGRSSHLPPGIGYHYIDFVTTMKRVIGFLGWEKKKFWFMGHSMGASIGMIYASVFPNTIERLITLDQMIPMADPPDDLVARLRNGITTFLAMDVQEEKESKSPPLYTHEEALDRVMKYALYCGYPLTEPGAKALLSRGTGMAGPGKLFFTRDHRLQTSNFVKYTPDGLLAILSNLRSHTLQIKAKEAPSYTLNSACYESTRNRAIELYNANCASYKLVEVPGNHFVHLNQPENVAQHMCDFLAPYMV